MYIHTYTYVFILEIQGFELDLDFLAFLQVQIRLFLNGVGPFEGILEVSEVIFLKFINLRSHIS